MTFFSLTGISPVWYYGGVFVVMGIYGWYGMRQYRRNASQSVPSCDLKEQQRLLLYTHIWRVL